MLNSSGPIPIRSAGTFETLSVGGNLRSSFRFVEATESNPNVYFPFLVNREGDQLCKLTAGIFC